MEQSAFEAVMIGVNAFVFIVALSAGILLMSNVIDMVNFANERAIVGMNGTIAESVGVVEDRIYTGAQMLTYYREQIEQQEKYEQIEGQELDYEFKVKLSEIGEESKLAEFVQKESLNKYYNRQFILQYKGKENNKDTYVFYGQAQSNQE